MSLILAVNDVWKDQEKSKIGEELFIYLFMFTKYSRFTVNANRIIPWHYYGVINKREVRQTKWTPGSNFKLRHAHDQASATLDYKKFYKFSEVISFWATWAPFFAKMEDAPSTAVLSGF